MKIQTIKSGGLNKLAKYAMVPAIALGIGFSGCSNKKIYRDVVELVKDEGEISILREENGEMNIYLENFKKNDDEENGPKSVFFKGGDWNYLFAYDDESNIFYIKLYGETEKLFRTKIEYRDYKFDGMRDRYDKIRIENYILTPQSNGEVLATTVHEKMIKMGDKKRFKKAGKEYKSLIKRIPELYEKSKK